eukprot:gene7742-917_t
MSADFIRGQNNPSHVQAGSEGMKGTQETEHDRVFAIMCFDEMQVSDVFSAVALKGLMEVLTSSGCVVVCTSNRAPRDLPQHGLHEAMFEHFIQTIETSCEVIELTSENDYRRLMLEDAARFIVPSHTHTHSSTSDEFAKLLAGRSYLQPEGSQSSTMLELLWQQVVQQEVQRTTNRGPSPSISPRPLSIPVMFGRTLDVPSSVGGLARFKFTDLCAVPLGPADYIAVASHFHTVFISDVPLMSMQIRDQARRFITLIDELYNARVRLVCTAAVAPDQLFRGAESDEPILDLEQLQFESAVEDGRLRRDVMTAGGVAPVASSPAAAREAAARLGGAEEQFAFRRAVSRLYEMQSPMYLASASSIAASKQPF